jgi:hypothetical protein
LNVEGIDDGLLDEIDEESSSDATVPQKDREQTTRKPGK